MLLRTVLGVPGVLASALIAVASVGSVSPAFAQACLQGSGLGSNSFACGLGAVANGTNSSAIGPGATSSVAAVGAVAIGYNSVATQPNTFSIGAAGATRRIVNVAAGTANTDAVNMEQLNDLEDSVAVLALFVGFDTGVTIALVDRVGTNTRAITNLTTNINNGTIGLVQQSAAGAPLTVGAGTDGAVVDFTGTDGTRRLTGLSDGTLSATSTDAVTGSQLFATNARVTTNATNIANLTTSVNTVSGNVTTLTTSITEGTIGLVQRDTTTNAITVASTFGGNSVDFTGTDGARVISGVANGLGADDAVNLSQLNAAVSGLTVNMPIVANNTSGLAAPSAGGADALAAGYGSSASGANSLAVGTSAQASFAGATAIGAGARATADPTTAVGFQAAATGDNASAFGGNAVASAVSATAIGQGASATGVNSTALGQNASAAQSGSTAIGAGAATSRANQVAIGGAASTYTLAGINSSASRAAQSGATRLVTADRAGNLGVSDFDFTAIAALDGRVGSLETGLNNLANFSFEARREARQGVAAAMAMTTAAMPSAAGRTSWSLNGATFKGEYGFGGSLAHRFDTQQALAVTAGYAYAGDNSHGVRVGLAGEF